MPNQNRFPELISGRSTKEVSSTIGVTTTTVSNWRMGRTRPDRKHWNDLAKFLDVDIETLSEYIQKDAASGRFHVIARRIASLPRASRNAVLQMLRAFEGGN